MEFDVKSKLGKEERFLELNNYQDKCDICSKIFESSKLHIKLFKFEDESKLIYIVCDSCLKEYPNIFTDEQFKRLDSILHEMKNIYLKDLGYIPYSSSHCLFIAINELMKREVHEEFRYKTK